MNLYVQTELATFAIDLDDESVLILDEPLERAPSVDVSLPRVVHAVACGSTVIALVDARPPLMVSHDAGTTWQQAGRGLPPGRALAIGDDPDLIAYASDERVWLSRDGGRFFTALTPEFDAITALSF